MAAHEGLSATATARQLVDQFHRGRTTGATTEVALETAATELSAALSATATVTPGSGAEADDLSEVRAALDDAADAVARARSGLSSGQGPGSASDLASAEAALRDLVGELGPPR